MFIRPPTLKALPLITIALLIVAAAVLFPSNFAYTYNGIQSSSLGIEFVRIIFGTIGLLIALTSIIYIFRVRIWADKGTVRYIGMSGRIRSCSRQDIAAIQQRGLFPSRYHSVRLAFVKKDGSDAFILSSGTWWKKSELEKFAKYLGIPFKRQLFSS